MTTIEVSERERRSQGLEALSPRKSYIEEGIEVVTDNESADGEKALSTPEKREIDAADGDEASLTPSVVFGILADKRERFILHLLEARGGTISVEELATRIAAWEQDTTRELLTNEMEERVRQTLHHADLPKLASYDLITYDPETGAVTPTERANQLEPYLEFVRSREREDLLAFIDQDGAEDR